VALTAATSVADSDVFTGRVLAGPTALGLVEMTHEVVTTRLSATVQPGSQAEFGRAVRAAVKAAFDREGLVTAAAIRTSHAGATDPAATAEESSPPTAGGE
jgi:small-conductance mechanosensitive channel